MMRARSTSCSANRRSCSSRTIFPFAISYANCWPISAWGEIQLAACGQEALERLRSFTPTLIISDWHMKPMDGFALLKEVRRGRTAVSAQTAFIFLTSENNAEKIQAIIRNGVDHVLVKPFNRSVVMKAVMHVAQTNAINVRGPSPAQPCPAGAQARTASGAAQTVESARR